ncbi:MAG TPA: ASKHA domain-containing protein [Euzebya sp.]|nr:ASKHA domain-containing protein [Euzebya sp.]
MTALAPDDAARNGATGAGPTSPNAPAAPDVEVVFTPAGRRGRVAAGTTVLEAARRLGVDLDSVCGGRGICGRCQVEVGERPGVPADPRRLGPVTTTETDYHGRRPLDHGRRLGCAARITDAVVIAVPVDSQVHRQVVRKDLGLLEIAVDPVIRLRYVELAEPQLDDTTGDLQRLRQALLAEWQVPSPAIDLTALADLQPALAAGRRGITVGIRQAADHDGTATAGDSEIVAVWPGLRDTAYGVGIDIGSTTIAGHLCDLQSGAILASSGQMNPQIAFGEDLMSRVSYVMMNPDGRERLTGVVRQALAGLVADLCAQADLQPTDVLEVCIVGNPIMHHLALGLDPTSLGSAPFALATTDAVTVRAADLDLGIHPGARVYAPPCIAGHVGADAAAMVLAEAPHRRADLTLLVDVGTNAEIVLGNRDRVLAASSPTGPAFEGAQISAGQRAAPGAIERVRIDRATLVPRFKVIGSELWSDDPGFGEATASTGVTGICGSGIIEVIAELFLAGVIAGDGSIVRPADIDSASRIVQQGRTLSYRLSDTPLIEVTQNDVRAIQLAKAALYAGCRLLMDHLGVDGVQRIRLAGAFGSHIDPLYAMVLGLVPDCDLDAVEAAGNAAGHGALMALLSATARAEVQAVTRTIEKIETATEPSFQQHFVAAMGFPHTTAPFPNLAARVTLPIRAATGSYGSPNPTRRRRSR